MKYISGNIEKVRLNHQSLIEEKSKMFILRDHLELIEHNKQFLLSIENQENRDKCSFSRIFKYRNQNLNLRLCNLGKSLELISKFRDENQNKDKKVITLVCNIENVIFTNDPNLIKFTLLDNILILKVRDSQEGKLVLCSIYSFLLFPNTKKKEGKSNFFYKIRPTMGA